MRLLLKDFSCTVSDRILKSVFPFGSQSNDKPQLDCLNTNLEFRLKTIGALLVGQISSFL